MLELAAKKDKETREALERKNAEERQLQLQLAASQREAAAASTRADALRNQPRQSGGGGCNIF